MKKILKKSSDRSIDDDRTKSHKIQQHKRKKSAKKNYITLFFIKSLNQSILF